MPPASSTKGAPMIVFDFLTLYNDIVAFLKKLFRCEEA